MLYLSIVFLLHVVAVATSSNSCLIQTCSASQGGDIVATIYNTSDPEAGGQNDADAVANFLTSNCGTSPQITQCYVDCNGIYGRTGAYWTDQNCGSQCGIVDPLENRFGCYAWICSPAVSNVCQMAAPSTLVNNSIRQLTGTRSEMEPQARDEFKCYGLPYGALGFVSHIIMLYNVVCLLNLRRSYWPCSKIQRNGCGFWNIVLSCAMLAGTTTLTIITMVRCKNHWRYILLAVEQLCLSIGTSLLSFSASTSDEDSHQFNSWMIYLCIISPGGTAGVVGYFALLAQNWSNHNVRIAFGSTFAGGFVISAVAFMLAPLAPDGTNPLSYLMFIYLVVVALDDWIFGIIAKNISGAPTGPVKQLIWLYFAIRRLAMLVS